MQNTWNYRVIQFVDPATGPWWSIHEVYYVDGAPDSYTESPAHVTWDTSEGDEAPKVILAKFQQALILPVLTEKDFHV